jgi:hypothetical protein
VIGSAETGHACFTCITGEADPSEDYEIAEACDKRSMRAPARTAPAPAGDSKREITDDELPF